MNLADKIKSRAVELGFDLVGITDAHPLDAQQAAFMQSWLKNGFAGQMHYMHKNLEKRLNPASLLINAQSVIVVALNYNRPGKSSASKTGFGKVASYACYEDYHPFIKDRLYKLAEFITAEVKEKFQFKVCVDSAPTAERALAERAGLGFIGKNHILINPLLGCRLFLGELITTLNLPSDEPVSANCSDCNRCIDACPTGALRQDGYFDATRCINYLTIEYKGQIPSELAGKIGDRQFGCEDCITACPYQKNAPACKNTQFKFFNERELLNLNDILNLNDDSFNANFADSPIKRIGLDGLQRNARICLTNENP
jgi:epoxyqueuosine reductase